MFSDLLEVLGGLSFIVGVFAFYALGLRAFGRRAGIKDIKHILAGISVVRIGFTVGYVFVAIVVILAFLAGFDVGLEGSFVRLLVLVFLVFPVFLCACYVFAMSQINLVLNIVLQRHYEKSVAITDETTRLAVQRLLHRWSLLHRLLFMLRKTSLREVEAVVCPAEHEGSSIPTPTRQAGRTSSPGSSRRLLAAENMECKRKQLKRKEKCS